jgi:hypothetical protein
MSIKRKWIPNPDPKGKTPRLRRPRFDIQAHPYTCGPVALLNAWTWQHIYTDEPSTPLPMKWSELLKKCNCTPEGTEDDNLYTDFLIGDVQRRSLRDLDNTEIKLWMTQGHGMIIKHPVPRQSPHLVFVHSQKQHGVNEWKYIVNNAYKEGKPNQHLKLTPAELFHQILQVPEWPLQTHQPDSEVEIWFVERNGDKQELLPPRIYRTLLALYNYQIWLYSTSGSGRTSQAVN